MTPKLYCPRCGARMRIIESLLDKRARRGRHLTIWIAQCAKHGNWDVERERNCGRTSTRRHLTVYERCDKCEKT